jgi:predicted N-formylglutamate amidohydrolase
MENHLYPEIIISCEHAGNQIPVKYQHLFLKAGDILSSHRGWDPGALGLALTVSDHLKVPLFKFNISRLLVEINRSVGHRRVFSEFTSVLSELDKQRLLESYYLPYRKSVEEKIEELNRSGKTVLHIGIHTFTPVFKNKTRKCDIGILYDPIRDFEKKYCTHLKQLLKDNLPHLNILSNQPYKGVDDGLTSYLRTQISESQYLGIELEVNQRFLNQKNQFPKDICRAITHSIESSRLKAV